MNHLLAMTAEDLHSKADIAAELAHRDIQINILKARIAELETPDQFWLFDNPEDSCTGNSEALVNGFFDELGGQPKEFVGNEFRVMRSRKLPDLMYKITGFTLDKYNAEIWQWEESEVTK